MSVSQKCQYALRAVLELAKRYETGPAKISDVAESQAIPIRFLEVILNQLKQGGFTDSRRGKEGGYTLIRSPRELTVGDIIRFVEGPLGPVECVNGKPMDKCPLRGDCIFFPLWERVKNAVTEIYDSTTFQDLVDEDRRRTETYVPEYSI
jgi:Rrf2 family protein